MFRSPTPPRQVSRGTVRRLAVAPAVGLLLAVVVALAAGAQGPSKLVNGTLTPGFPTAGALLFGNDPDTATGSCTGTMVGCDTFVTAAHCVCDEDGTLCQSAPNIPDPGDYLVFLQHAGFFSIASIALRSGFDFPVADVAVLKLTTPVNGISPTPINTTISPPSSSVGTIVGFGRSGGTAQDYGLKRTGRIETTTCLDESNVTSVCWNFVAPIGPPGEDSSTCNGDSGGPLYIDLGAGDVLAGVTSGGVAEECLAPATAFDANIYAYRDWIQAQGLADLGNQTCGDLAQVGTPGVTVVGFSGDVSAGVPEGRHQFVVDPETVHLVVTMNASEAGSNDFDLFVKFGAPAATNDWDCRATGGNNWGSCEFASPSAGSWHVLVNRYDGDGTYQTTATAFKSGAAPVPSLSPPAAAATALLLMALSLVALSSQHATLVKARRSKLSHRPLPSPGTCLGPVLREPAAPAGRGHRSSRRPGSSSRWRGDGGGPPET